MSVKVKIPTQLRNLTGGVAEVQADGATLQDLVSDIESKHPGFKERILDETGFRQLLAGEEIAGPPGPVVDR